MFFHCYGMELASELGQRKSEGGGVKSNFLAAGIFKWSFLMTGVLN